jgi:hypothetical protein
MVQNYYFTPFLPFPWPINCNHTSRCTKFSTHSLPSWFWSNFFSFPWIHGVAHDHVLWALSHTSEWIIAPGVILRFHIDLTPSWWKSRITKDVPSSWSWTPLSLVLSHFFKLLYLGDFLAGRPCFWWWTWNCLRRFIWN